jgi:hypothetical protein
MPVVLGLSGTGKMAVVLGVAGTGKMAVVLGVAGTGKMAVVLGVAGTGKMAVVLGVARTGKMPVVLGVAGTGRMAVVLGLARAPVVLRKPIPFSNISMGIGSEARKEHRRSSVCGPGESFFQEVANVTATESSCLTMRLSLS